jgi:hypothetical protein
VFGDYYTIESNLLSPPDHGAGVHLAIGGMPRCVHVQVEFHDGTFSEPPACAEYLILPGRANLRLSYFNNTGTTIYRAAIVLDKKMEKSPKCSLWTCCPVG